MHFLIRNECAMHAFRQRRPGRQIQHVAVAEQRFRTDWSRMVRESILLETWNAMGVGILALISR